MWARTVRVRMAFSSGTQPGQLLARNMESADTLSQDLAALAMAPRVSLSDAHTQVERRESFEASYQHVSGSRTYSAGFYHEAVSNAAFLLSGPDGFSAVERFADGARVQQPGVQRGQLSADGIFGVGDASAGRTFRCDHGGGPRGRVCWRAEQRRRTRMHCAERSARCSGAG